MGAGHCKNMPAPEGFADLWGNSKYTVNELKQWYSSFLRAYPNKSINTEDFVEHYYTLFPGGNASSFAEQAFSLFDTNEDGRIDFRELAIALGVACRGNREEKMKWLFSLYDINSDGNIKKYEMRIILKALIGMTGVKNARKVDLLVESHMKDIFEELDKNSDGLLSFEEFVQVGDTSTLFMDAFEQGMARAPGGRGK